MAKCGERFSERDAHKNQQEQAVARYLGLSVGGAKSDHTCLTVIDYYRKQEKSFVIDVFESIGSLGEQTADQVLIELLNEISKDSSANGENGVRVMGVDAPLTLPPCLLGCEASCQGYEKCKRPAVKWMRQQYLKQKRENSKLKHFTPYSQRPVDLYFRYKHPEHNLFQDETMGANLAPQAVRMNYLKRHFGALNLVEVWPKLSLFYIQKALKLNKREVLDYRHIERGAGVRQRIVDRLVEKSNIFIYERDLKKFVTNMDAFDSFLCAWIAMQSDLNQVVKFKAADVPLDSGWVQIPEL